VRIVEVTHADDLAPLRDEWNGLLSTASGGDVFQSYEWLQPWLRTYWSGGRILFLFVYDADELVGVVPLVRDGTGTTWCSGSLVSPVNPQVRRQGILYKGDLGSMLDAALRHIVREGQARCTAFRQLPVGGVLARELSLAARRARMFVLRQHEIDSSVAGLSGGWDPYVASRRRQVAREIRRKTRKIEAAGGWSFRCITEPEDWETAFEAVLAVEAESWKHRKGTSIANEPGAREFYGEVMRLNAERGRMCVYVLEHGARAVAHVFGLVDGQTLLALKTAYDEEYKSWAPGAVLMWHAIEDAARRGLSRFDFLGDAAAWKESLGTEMVLYTSICLFPWWSVRCHGCRAMELAVKPTARRLGIATLMRQLRTPGAS
jgi:CelD/BcsL family acetyltransferase involved in cellulose biosynthesis